MQVYVHRDYVKVTAVRVTVTIKKAAAAVKGE
jgi:hypothetical protein